MRKWMEQAGKSEKKEYIERDNGQIKIGGQMIPRGTVKHT